ncbi:MAG TPA: glycosyl transferase [Candidatus Omnitrophica bacterium]|nr:glycosyl transferase [Candidatus Omnitrophota bacterium]
MKLSIIIPVFNERDTILQVIEKVENTYSQEKEIIIIDDYSTDGSRELLVEYCGKHKHMCLSLNAENYGKGRCIRNGLSYATGDFVIIQDADLELDPLEYTGLIKVSLTEKNVDAVFGSRIFPKDGKHLGMQRIMANKLLTYSINLLYGARLSDIMTCYKLIKREVFLSLSLKSDRFDIEAEITCKLLKKGVKIFEVPITYMPRGWDEGKKIRAKDFFKVLKAILRYRFSD